MVLGLGLVNLSPHYPNHKTVGINLLMDLSTFDSIHFGVNNGEYEWKTKTTMFLDKSLRRKFVILNGT